MSTAAQSLYQYPRLDDIEDLECYRPGGFHPVSIGVVFSRGRYKVLHKLGCGGTSTVWLARDKIKQAHEEQSGTLVTLKVLAAEAASKPFTDIPDLYVPQELAKIVRNMDHPGKENLQVIQDHFVEEGPNGSHLCLVYPLAGPSVFSMSESPGRVSGSRRIRGDLARKVARQVSSAVELLHSVGIVHGDLTTSNVLFRTSAKVHKWSDDEVYQILGSPQEEEVISRDGSAPGLSAPSKVVAPIDISCLCVAQFLEEDVILIDFGQSFFVHQMPKDYATATPFHYTSPEAHFDSKVGLASDVWTLACVLFEIRSGFPLFEPFFASTHEILKQMVEMLGRFPDPWWGSWNQRLRWFDEGGDPRPVEAQERDGILVPAEKNSIHQQLRGIGVQDVPPHMYEGVMIETTGTRLVEEEVDLLADLLEKMLRYRPQDRITMKEVLRHPWFDYK